MKHLLCLFHLGSRIFMGWMCVFLWGLFTIRKVEKLELLFVSVGDFFTDSTYPVILGERFGARDDVFSH